MARPRALVIAYDFPPHGAIGTMRTLRLVQRLAGENWDVKVLTSDPRTFRPGTPVDETLLLRVPASVAVVRAAAFRGFDALKGAVRKQPIARALPEGASAAPVGIGERTPRALTPRKIASQGVDLVDAALTIPDHESGWVVPAVTRGLSTCRSWRPDVVYSSAPPWSGQLVARQLASLLRCPWVADFRDPWARAPWREARRDFVKRANALLERSVIRRANAVLFVTGGNLAEFSAFYGPETSRRFHLVPSGCDPSEFDGITGLPPAGRFVLLHAGTLYGARNPLPLVHAIARAIQRGALKRETFRLRLLGPVNLPVDLAAETRRLGVDDVVELIPRVTRAESLREMVCASALLLVQPGTTVSVPGKAYEYLAAGRPLLALAEEGETADLVRASGIGVSVRPDAGVEAVEAALLEVMAIASRTYAPPPRALYDGRVHAATAARILEEVARRSSTTTTIEPVGPEARRGVPVQFEESGR